MMDIKKNYVIVCIIVIIAIVLAIYLSSNHTTYVLPNANNCVITDISVGYNFSTNTPGTAYPVYQNVPANVLLTGSNLWNPQPSNSTASSQLQAVFEYIFLEPVTLTNLLYKSVGDTTHDATSITLYTATYSNGIFKNLYPILSNYSLKVGTSVIQTIPLTQQTHVQVGTCVLAVLSKNTGWQMVLSTLYFS
jgi:hypothetical protein